MTQSLYERLGGSEGITDIANDLVELHVNNPTISARFADSDLDAMKNGAATFFITGTGGPAVYELRQHWDHDEIVEIMAVIALFGFLNRWNDSMGSALEELPIQAGEQHLEQTGWGVGKHR